MSVKTILLVVNTFLFSTVLSQKTTKLNLMPSYRVNPFGYQAMSISKGNYLFTSIDTATFIVILKAQLHYQPYQYLWQNYKLGNYTLDTINYIIKNYRVDTTQLYKKPISEAVYVLVLYDKQKKDTILLFNNILSKNISIWHKISFTDISHSFMDINKPQSKVYALKGIEIFNRGEKITRPVYLFPILEMTSQMLIKRISFVNSYYTSGRIESIDKGIKIYLGNRKAQHFFDNYNSGIRIIDETKQEGINNAEPYQIGDTVNIRNNIYILYKVSPDGKNLWIKELGKERKKVAGYNEGYQYQKFSFKDLVDGSQISTNIILKDKNYLLLDFWGTWCGPCIQGVPVLRGIYEKYSRDIELIGIAGEHKADTANVLSAIAKYNMPWKHLMFYKNDELNKELLLNKYRISSYPTYILIGKNGVIEQRQIGTNGIDLIETFLKNKLGY